jgi:hypothetical protein
MKRVFLVVAIGLLWAWSLPAAALAEGADVYGVGGGKVLGNFATFSLSAHEGLDGDFGQVQAKIPTEPLDLLTDVDCVNVFGMAGAGGAWIGSVVKKVNPDNIRGLAAGDRVMWLINDGGSPSSTTPLDFINGFGPPLANTDCKTLGPSFAPPDVTSGNIVVKTG